MRFNKVGFSIQERYKITASLETIELVSSASSKSKAIKLAKFLEEELEGYFLSIIVEDMDKAANRTIHKV